MQLGDFVLAYQGALLGLAQLHLQLLHLAFVAALLLLALLVDRVAVVLQGITTVQVFLFQRANLLVFVLQAQLKISQCLSLPGIARLFTLKQGARALQCLGFLGQCQALQLVVLLQLRIGLLGLLQLRFQRLALLLVLFAGLVNGFLGLLFKALREACYQRQQLFVDRLGRGFVWPRGAIIELLHVAMDRGFRAGIAHFDPYGIDAGVFATGKDRQSRRLHHLFVHAATGHEISFCFAVWYVPRKKTHSSICRGKFGFLLSIQSANSESQSAA
ncbi:hypothetical protein D3C76_1120490 [compost metagenome]